LDAREALAQLAALPALQREVMLGSALEGRSHEELAADLGLSGGSVRGLIYRARSTLRAAAAALIPSPVVDWALRSAAVRTGSAYGALAGGGSVGIAGVLMKGGAAATVAGALAGAAAIVTTQSEHRLDHRPRAALVRPARQPRTSRSSNEAPILLAATVAPGGAGDARPPAPDSPAPSVGGHADTAAHGHAMGNAVAHDEDQHAVLSPDSHQREGYSGASTFDHGEQSGSGTGSSTSGGSDGEATQRSAARPTSAATAENADAAPTSGGNGTSTDGSGSTPPGETQPGGTPPGGTLAGDTPPISTPTISTPPGSNSQSPGE
jgi:hypothetical protein